MRGTGDSDFRPNGVACNALQHSDMTQPQWASSSDFLIAWIYSRAQLGITMALTFITRASSAYPNSPSSPAKRGHSKPLPVNAIELDKPGRLRAGHLMTLFSVSHSTLYNHMHSGLIPQADGTDGIRPFWNTSTIKAALDA